MAVDLNQSLFELKPRVETILVSSSAAVSADLERLLFDALLDLERRHGFLAMEGEAICRTVVGQSPTFLRSTAPVGMTYLRPRPGESPKPWRPDVPVAIVPASYTTVSYTDVAWFNVSADGLIQLDKFGPTTWRDLGFVAGQTVQLPTIPPIGSWSSHQQYVVQGFASSDLTMRLTADDTGKSIGGDFLSIGQTIQVVLPVRTTVTELDWITAEQARLKFQDRSAAMRGAPRYVQLVEKPGGPSFDVFPESDAGPGQDGTLGDFDFYEVHVPCLLHLGTSLYPDVLADVSNWFTRNATDYLVWKAAAEALRLEREHQEAQFYEEKADGEARRLIRQDGRQRVRPTTLTLSDRALPDPLRNLGGR